MVRILVARIFHEGNSFTSLRTSQENFVVHRGRELVVAARQTNSSLGGAISELEKEGAVIVPALSAVAPPGGPVLDAVYTALKNDILKAAASAQPDGVYLELHGAMITESLDDPEGDLLGALRHVVGSQAVIAVSLDLHAHVTPAMLAAANVVVACKENPHTDYHIAGERAVALMLRAIEKEIKPVTTAVWIPLMFGSKMETAAGPLADIHNSRREILSEEPSIVDISIYNTHTLLDVALAGQCVTVISNDDAALGKETATRLARHLWERRHEFTPDFAPLDDVLRSLAEERTVRPVIIGDQGDRVLAGAPGDGTAIISALLEHWPSMRAVVPLTEPIAVSNAKSLGCGAIYSEPIGGRLSKDVPPVTGSWLIENLGDGHFIHEGPFLAGEPGMLGGTAILRRGNLTLLVTSIPGFTQDPAAFYSQGVKLDEFDLIVAKSGYHFKISFEKLGTCIVVDTPGVSNYRPGLLTYRNRRPVFPEDTIEEPSFQSHIFP
ncbi:M81 family metallopeptidase [Pseudochelatococcus sp. B33]